MEGENETQKPTEEVNQENNQETYKMREKHSPALGSG